MIHKWIIIKYDFLFTSCESQGFWRWKNHGISYKYTTRNCTATLFNLRLFMYDDSDNDDYICTILDVSSICIRWWNPFSTNFNKTLDRNSFDITQSFSCVYWTIFRKKEVRENWQKNNECVVEYGSIQRNYTVVRKLCLIPTAFSIGMFSGHRCWCGIQWCKCAIFRFFILE